MAGQRLCHGRGLIKPLIKAFGLDQKLGSLSSLSDYLLCFLLVYCSSLKFSVATLAGEESAQFAFSFNLCKRVACPSHLGVTRLPIVNDGQADAPVVNMCSRLDAFFISLYPPSDLTRPLLTCMPYNFCKRHFLGWRSSCSNESDDLRKDLW